MLQVAVKVLRGKLFDGQREERMKRVRIFMLIFYTLIEIVPQRLRRELRVWQKLDHENVIPLYGKCMDYGHYASLVCPWFDRGSLRHHLDTRGVELQLSQRLKMVRKSAADYVENAYRGGKRLALGCRDGVVVLCVSFLYPFVAVI